ncbi:polysaccharide deacetylase family protein [Desulfovibrio sp. OttesenSCG-928-G11]|nr:polysaccharide deacetylase family protein [Desulfovibrio sp. OttesenSCG-928-G11]
MPPKIRYPRRKGLREKMPLRRLWPLLALLGAVPVLFFLLKPVLRADQDKENAVRHENRAEPVPDQSVQSEAQGLEALDSMDALDRLAASISMQREGRSGSSSSQAGMTDAAARGDSPASAPTAGEDAGRPSVRSAEQSTGHAAGQAAPSAPFAGKSLDETALELTRRYAGSQPRLWGERMPGITSSLPPGGGAALSGARPPDRADRADSADSPDTADRADQAPKVMALTLDACAGKKGESFDKGIIDYLRAEKIPATIFVTGLWIKNNAEILRDLAADPLFEIAAHGAAHKPASVNGRAIYGIAGTASIAELVREVEGNVRAIEALTGKRPRWYRSGTAYYDDVAVSVISDLGLDIAGYSIAGDEGATLAPDKVRAKVAGAGAGDILLLHLNKPRSGSREGLLAALPLLKQGGVRFVRLSDRIQAPLAVKP